MICADATMMTDAEALRAAQAVQESQVRALRSALLQVMSRMSSIPERIILCGHGEFLARQLFVNREPGALNPEIISLSQALGPQIGRSAPAHALAVLANEQLQPTTPDV